MLLNCQKNTQILNFLSEQISFQFENENSLNKLVYYFGQGLVLTVKFPLTCPKLMNMGT